MTCVYTHVSDYSLNVDAEETIRAVLAAADRPWGRRLNDALLLAGSEATAYAVAPYAPVPVAALRPDVPPRADRPDIAACDAAGVLRALAGTGLAEVRTVWSEPYTDAYLNTGRQLLAVHVLRPFVVLGMRYWHSREALDRLARHGYVYSDRWEVTERSHIVPAGWYLVGLVGEFLFTLVGAAAVAFDSDEHPDAVAERLALRALDTEGFGAAHCMAECRACGSRWCAESGSWLFRPEGDTDARGWDFDTIGEVSDTGTVPCPHCKTGQVGFCVS
ncbi:hypothetical protein [Crossiella cryophila]|uniref:Uncharacterized protein n=1 Tax=Crossiella cryophila TaxID=43355 RepID=A0A7W7CE62_9PSEU|nr:hypothetical protein [Crossiella cryophila]MBB4679499.1 hypothetical protein [Crossiella cryophila]